MLSSFLASVVQEICKLLPREFIVVVYILALEERVHLYRKFRL